MKRHVFVRPAKPSDVEKFTEWSLNTENNLFDPEVVKFPTTFTLCAFNEQGPILFMPVQQPLMMESLAINPEADVMDVAVALKEITQAVVTQAFLKGAGEIYFACKDEDTIKFAQHQAFEEVPYRFFRIKLKELEK